MLPLLSTVVLSIASPTVCTKGPCGPGNDQCVGKRPASLFYTFHLTDTSCDINDPNGPFYDEVHGMYHNFYQDHLAEPQTKEGPGRGPDWGHWVSRDFLHWARLPVAIWNDKWYDAVAIYSGSTTIVDGKPIIVYPGLCQHGLHGCEGTDYVATVPKNASDPFYTEWVKEGPQMNGIVNPIVNHTGDDPSTAWQTEHGEWRLIGNQGCTSLAGGNGDGDGHNSGAPIYGSMDFKSWYKVGCTTLQMGDCPTFFPLPPLTPGSTVGLTEADYADMPNYVHKAGSSNDRVQVGTWTDGTPGHEGVGTPGTWSQKGGSIPLDNGKTHASKDFWDPIKKRRIMWVWGTLAGGLQTIPRDMTYNPKTNKINYAPVEEMAALRTKVIAKLQGGTTPMALPASGASDMEIVFTRPTASANVTFAVAAAGGTFYIDYAGTGTAACGFAAASSMLHANSVDSRHKAVHAADTLDILDSDTEISMRIFFDNKVAEVYFMGGRVAMTVEIPTSNYDVKVMASPTAVLVNATSWQMGSIHVDQHTVLATPRLQPRL